MMIDIKKERNVKHSNTKVTDTVGVNKICNVARYVWGEIRREGGSKDEGEETNKGMNELCWRPEEITAK